MPPDDTLPDPSQYATPNQLAAQRALAKGLLEQGFGPITPSSGGAISGLQGIGGILQSLAGRQLLERSTAQEQGTNRAAARGAATAGGEDQPPQSGGGPLSAAPPAALGYADPISKYSSATSTVEGTGGSYDALGRVIKSPQTGQPDRAYGKYQVMGENIPQWTKEVLGTSMTPQQFLQNPQAQEAVYRTKFSQLVQKYGPEGAAKAWFAGERGMSNPNAKDANGMTVARYGGDFSKALAFNGEPSNAPQGGSGPLATRPPGGPDGQALALQRPAPQTGGLPTPSMAPAARGGSTMDQPAGTLPVRPRVTRQQFEAVMSNPLASPEQKKDISDFYYSQNQPLQTQGPYGSTVVIDPRNPNSRWVLPGPVHMDHLKAGDVETPAPIVTMPPGSSVGPPDIRVIPPQSGRGAAPAPAAPQSGAPAEIPHDLMPPPKATPFAAEGNAPQGELPDIITKGPEAVQAGGGPLAVKPPAFASENTQAPAGQPGQQVAQGSPDLYSMTPGELANWSQNRDIQTTAVKEFNKQDIEQYNKDYAENQTYGNSAINAAPQIALAQKIIHDPHFTQGPGTPIKLAWEQAKAFLGDQTAQTNLAYNQAFDKVIASNILGSMRSALKGLGQVRVAEINLLNRASAAQPNTIGANQAILDIAAQSQKQLMEIGKITNWYRQGYRWDDNGKLMTDQSGKPIIGNDRPTSAGQNAVIKTYLTKNPLLSEDQIKNYNDLLDAAEKGGGGIAQGPLSRKPPSEAAPAGAGQSLEELQQEKARRQQKKPPGEELPL
jgi:hypothetical protein